MTQVYLEQDGNRYMVHCMGHASGSEAVCAAVSAFVYALSGWLENGGGQVEKARLSEGEAMIRWRGGKSSKAAFDLVAIGLMQLAETEPDFISIEKAEIE